MEVITNLSYLRSIKCMPRISFWDDKKLGSLSQHEQEQMRSIINGIGHFSARAQHLRVPITDYNRIRMGNQNLYLCTSGIPQKLDSILVKGMLKVGTKNLYIRQNNGQLVQISPLCVLDFYIHEKYQRQGLGHELFEVMLQKENKHAHELGIDRPSTKLLSFLEKYYNLINYLPQANQFVVFKDYFEEQKNIKEEINLKRTLGAALPCVTTSTPCDNHEDLKRRQFFNNNYDVLDDAAKKKDKILYGRRAHSTTPNKDEENYPPHLRKNSVDCSSQDYYNSASSSLNMCQPMGRRPHQQEEENQEKDSIACDDHHKNHHLEKIQMSTSPSKLNNVVGEISCCVQISSQESGSGNLARKQEQKNLETKGERCRHHLHCGCIGCSNSKLNDKDNNSTPISSISWDKNPSSFNPNYSSFKREPRVRFADQCYSYNTATNNYSNSITSGCCNVHKANVSELSVAQLKHKCPPPLFSCYSSSITNEQGDYYDYGGGCDTKLSSVSSTPTRSFQSTRSCYHAGMQGLGAAQAMSFI